MARFRAVTTSSAVEIATLDWVTWWNTKRLHEALGYRTPVEVEEALAGVPGVAEVAVAALDVGDGVSIVCAWVVPTDPDDDPDALRQRVLERAGERLATYKLPARVEVVAELPRTTTGKIQKNVLRERA